MAAAPTCWRSSFRLPKRLKISHLPTALIRPKCQRAGLADAVPISNETLVAYRTKKERELMTPEEREKLPTHLQSLDKQTRDLIVNMPLPKSVTAVYLSPLRRKPIHGFPVCNLQMRSYSVRNLEFFADFAMRAAYYLRLPARGPVPLPRITERWTVPRSNFIFKKSQENFERKTLRRLIQIQDGHPDVVKAWLGYLERRCFYGVGLKANIWEHEALGVAARMEEVGERIDKEMEGEWRNFGTRKSVAESKEAMEKLLGDERFAVPIGNMEAYKREPIEVKRR